MISIIIITIIPIYHAVSRPRPEAAAAVRARWANLGDKFQ